LSGVQKKSQSPIFAGTPVAHAQNVSEMTVTMKNVNVSSETLLSNSTVIEAELDALEQQLRRLQAQADEDARLIHQVWQAQQQV